MRCLFLMIIIWSTFGQHLLPKLHILTSGFRAKKALMPHFFQKFWSTLSQQKFHVYCTPTMSLKCLCVKYYDHRIIYATSRKKPKWLFHTKNEKIVFLSKIGFEIQSKCEKNRKMVKIKKKKPKIHSHFSISFLYRLYYVKTCLETWFEETYLCSP